MNFYFEEAVMAEIISQGCKRGMPGHLELPLSVERLSDGNTLIADGGDERGFGSEVIEVDPFGNIVWQFDDCGRLRLLTALEGCLTVTP